MAGLDPHQHKVEVQVRDVLGNRVMVGAVYLGDCRERAVAVWVELLRQADCALVDEVCVRIQHAADDILITWEPQMERRINHVDNGVY